MSSAPNQQPSGLSGNVVVIAIALMFICVVGAATTMVMAVEDGARVESLIVIMLGALGTIVTAVAGLYVSIATKRQVDFLANGGTDAKVRAGIADMIDGRYLRDDVHEQLALDRAVRAREVVPVDPGKPATS